MRTALISSAVELISGLFVRAAKPRVVAVAACTASTVAARAEATPLIPTYSILSRCKFLGSCCLVAASPRLAARVAGS